MATGRLCRVLQRLALGAVVGAAVACGAVAGVKAPAGNGSSPEQTQAKAPAQAQAEQSSRPAAASNPRPRLYIQIQSQQQRAAAAQLRTAITGVKLEAGPVLGMASELVSNSGVKATELRCMSKSDCSQAAPLAAAIGKALGTSTPPVRDFSARYEGKTTARPFHYEVWFGPNEGLAAAASANGSDRPTGGGGANPAQTEVQITRLSLGSVKPESLRSGQAAIAEIAVTLGDAEQLNRLAPNFLASRLYLEVDGRRVSFERLAIVSTNPETAVAIVSGTFRPILLTAWRSMLGESRSVEVAVSDSKNSALLSPPLLINADSPIDVLKVASVVVAFAALVVVGLRLPYPNPLNRALANIVRPAAPSSVERSDPEPPPAAESRPRRPPPSPPPELLAAVAQHTAVLVLGAEASALAGAPTLGGFARRIIERGGPNIRPSLSRLTSGAIGPAAMDALLAAVPREELLEEAPRYFDRPGETALHHQLLAPSWRGVISLTFDRLVEQTLARRKAEAPWPVWTLEDGAEMADGLRDSRPFLIRPYGALDRPASVLFSPDEMQRQMYRTSEAQRALSFLLQHNTFVFIGVPPAELQALLTAIAPHAAPDAKHFALLPDEPDNEVMELSLEKFGVRVLPFDPADANAAIVGFATSVIRQSGNTPAGGPAASSNQLQSVRLSNIGIFRSLDLEFAAGPDAGGADWTVLFGGNGVGKSTVLRSIGLVLAGDDASAIPVGRRLLRSGADIGSVEVRMGDITYVTELRRDRTDVRVRAGQLSPVQAGAALVLGFPALRGAPSSNPRGPTKQKRVGPQAADVVPLVTGAVDDRLGSFKQWLVNVLVEARDSSPQALAKKSLLETLLREMVPGDIEAFAPIQGPDYEIRLHSRDGEVAFDNLSQGMSSIFNWLGVLVQRLYDVYPDARPPEHEPALLLIDEIDSHLHPDWQRRLVELTKRHFPKVQMVATSHSALLAGALQKGELCVFERGDDDEILVRRDLDLFGRRTQDILQSPAFSLTSDRAPGAEREIKAYFAAFEKAEANRTPEDAAVIEALGPRLEAIGYGHRPSDPLAALTPTDVDALKDLFSATSEAPEADRPQ